MTIQPEIRVQLTPRVGRCTGPPNFHWSGGLLIFQEPFSPIRLAADGRILTGPLTEIQNSDFVLVLASRAVLLVIAVSISFALV